MGEGSGDGAFVFGYGSLLGHRPGSHEPSVAHLRGLRRVWNIAMDNSVDLPGYKYYRRPDGTRPEVFVTFVNVVEDSESTINGVLFPVAEDDLRVLDARERNYERVDATPRLVGESPPGRVWTYVGTAGAVARYESGARDDRAVVSREYYTGVLDDFAALGDDALREFQASTAEPECPIVELERIDLG